MEAGTWRWGRGGGDVGAGDTGEAAALRQLASALRAVAGRVEARRAALWPSASTWWEGPAAERCREDVARRSAALASLVDRLRDAAAEADLLAGGPVLERGPARIRGADPP